MKRRSADASACPHETGIPPASPTTPPRPMVTEMLSKDFMESRRLSRFFTSSKETLPPETGPNNMQIASAMASNASRWYSTRNSPAAISAIATLSRESSRAEQRWDRDWKASTRIAQARKGPPCGSKDSSSITVPASASSMASPRSRRMSCSRFQTDRVASSLPMSSETSLESPSKTLPR